MPETQPTDDTAYPESWAPPHVRESRQAADADREATERHLASLDGNALLALIDHTLAKRKS